MIGDIVTVSDYEIRLPDFRGQPELPIEIDEFWEVTEWYVSEGDKVIQDQSFVHIETDDLAFDLNAPVRGTIKSLVVQAGQKIKTGDLLAIFDFVEIDD